MITDYLDFRIEMERKHTQFSKRGIMSLRGIFYCNLALALLNGHFLYHSPTYFIATVFGSLIANVLWLSGELLRAKQDLKFERELLAKYEEIRDNEVYKGMLKQLENAKKQYEEMTKNMQPQS